MSDKRLRYYNGQFLQEQDFTAEQDYHLDRQRRHNRQLHTYGIAEGLTVTAGVGATSAVVSPGTAVDGEGRTIILTESRNVPFNGLTGAVLVVISYAQQTSDPATVGDEGNTRWWERPDVEVIAAANPPAADVRIRLAALQIAGNNTVSSHDTAVRTSAGVKLGTEVSIERIRLSRQGVDQAQWPVLSSGAAGRADVTGNLSVTGNITVTGTVDGRDVSTDGVNLDTHRNRIDNPHSVTAAQVLAITGVGGVLNPGGQVNLQAGSNILITPDNGTNKRITIAGAAIDGVTNPAGNIDFVGATGITVTPDNVAKTITFTGGAPTSIDGVSNPGGNIDFVGQGGISITPDNTGKLIAFNTSPAALGVLPANEYLRRATASVWFSQDQAEGATSVVNIGFQPRFIWVSGRMHAYLNGGPYGGAISGFCRVNSTSSWDRTGFGPYINRFNAVPYWYTYMTVFSNSVCGFICADSVSSPSLYASIQFDITAVTATGFTVMLHRYHGGSTSPGFFIEAHFACIG